MSSICFDCLNKSCNGKLKAKDYIVSRDYDLCEDCGKMKSVVIAEKKAYYLHKLQFIRH